MHAYVLIFVVLKCVKCFLVYFMHACFEKKISKIDIDL